MSAARARPWAPRTQPRYNHTTLSARSLSGAHAAAQRQPGVGRQQAQGNRLGRPHSYRPGCNSEYLCTAEG